MSSTSASGAGFIGASDLSASRLSRSARSAKTAAYIGVSPRPSNSLYRRLARASGEAVLIDYGLAHHRDLPDLLQEEFRLLLGLV